MIGAVEIARLPPDLAIREELLTPNMSPAQAQKDFVRIPEGCMLTMSTLFNVGRTDRVLRLLLGVGLGLSAVLVHGHPYARLSLILVGIAVILSGTCGI